MWALGDRPAKGSGGIRLPAYSPTSVVRVWWCLLGLRGAALGFSRWLGRENDRKTIFGC